MSEAEQTMEHDNTKASAQEKKELLETANKVQDVLIKAETVFPFTIFPDTVAVSRMKVAITKRAFFQVSEVVSLQIEDLLNIEADTGPFFGRLKIYTKIYGNDPQTINYLPRKDTIEVKRMIEGLIIAHKKKINIMDLDIKDCCHLLRQLGSDKPLT
jgi:hypothetical protein